MLSEGKTALGVLLFADPIKPGARDALDELKRLRVRTVLLSGDNAQAAKAVSCNWA